MRAFHSAILAISETLLVDTRFSELGDVTGQYTCLLVFKGCGLKQGQCNGHEHA